MHSPLLNSPMEPTGPTNEYFDDQESDRTCIPRSQSRSFRLPGEPPGVEKKCCRFPVWLDLVYESVRNRFLTIATCLMLITLVLLPSQLHAAMNIRSVRLIDNPVCDVVNMGNQTDPVWYIEVVRLTKQTHITPSLLLYSSVPFILIGNSLVHSIGWIIPGTAALTWTLAIATPDLSFDTITPAPYKNPDTDIHYYAEARCVDRDHYAFQPSGPNVLCEEQALAVCHEGAGGMDFYSDPITNVCLWMTVFVQTILCYGMLIHMIVGACIRRSDGERGSIAASVRHAWFKFRSSAARLSHAVSRRVFPLRPPKASTAAPVKSDEVAIEDPLHALFRFPVRLLIATSLGFILLLVYGTAVIITANDLLNQLSTIEHSSAYYIDNLDHYVREGKAIFFLSSTLAILLALHSGWCAHTDFKRDCLADPRVRRLILLASSGRMNGNGGRADTTDAISSPVDSSSLQIDMPPSASFPASPAVTPVPLPVYQSSAEDSMSGGADVDLSIGKDVHAVASSPYSTDSAVADDDAFRRALATSLVYSSNFIGAYIAMVLLATLILWFFVFLLLTVLIFDPVRDLLLSQWIYLLTVFWAKVAQKLIQWCIQRYLVGTNSTPGTLKHPRIYLAFDSILTLSSAITGPLSALSRILVGLGSSLVQMYRIDRSIVLPPYQALDGVYGTYCALIQSQEYTLRFQQLKHEA